MPCRAVRPVETALLFTAAALIILKLTRQPFQRPSSLVFVRPDATEVVIGVLSLVMSLAGCVMLARPDSTPHFRDALACYAVAGVLLVYAALRRSLDGRSLSLGGLRGRAAACAPEAAVCAAIVLLGIGLRLYAVTYYPPYPGAVSDETVLGQMAAKMVADPSFRPIYLPMGGSVNLYHPIALAFSVLSANTLTLRLPSVLVGILTLLPFYGVARNLFAVPVALTVLGLFAVSFWHNSVARFAFDWVYMGFFAMLTIYFVLRGQRSGHWLGYCASGIALGLGIYSYAAFRLVPFLIVLYLVYKAVLVRDFGRRQWPNLLVMAAAFVAVAAPNLIVAARGGSWMGASFAGVVSPMTRHLTGETAVAAGARVAAALVRVTARYSSEWPSIMSRDRGFLDPVVAVLFVLGLVFCTVYFWRRENFLLAAMTLIPITVAAGLTTNQLAYRFFVIIPLVYLVAGALLQALLERFAHGPSSRLANVSLAGLVALSGAWNLTALNQHSQDCQARSPFMDRPYAVMQYAQDAGRGYRVYVISSFPWHLPFDNYAWLAGDTPVEPVANIYDAIPAPASGERGVIYLVTDPLIDVVLGYLTSVYPAGVTRTVPPDHCTPQMRFAAFHVNPAALTHKAEISAVPHGLLGRYFSGAGFQGAPSTRLDPPFRSRFDTEQRLSVIWNAQLAAPTAGVYTFTVTTAQESTLLIDGVAVVRNPGHNDNDVPAEGASRLAAGPHALELRYDRAFNSGTMELRWTPPGGSSEIIPLSALTATTSQ